MHLLVLRVSDHSQCMEKVMGELCLMFVDPCTFIKKNPTRCNSVSKFYYSVFIWSSTRFGRHITHHQEPKIALAASGFSYVEGCWACSWWTVSGVSLTPSTNYSWQLASRIRMELQIHPDPARGLSANLYDIYHCCVYSEKTHDDRQRNCPKHVEFPPKNKFEKLAHLVGFIIKHLSRCTVTWTSNVSSSLLLKMK